MAEGDGSSRNFRSAYYEKLGFCGNEEKNILDLLISSSPFNLEKLGDLCERFDLDRHCVEAWKILLGVECGRKNPFDEFANVRHVRAEHFQSLKHHLEVLLKHNTIMKDRLYKRSNLEPNLCDISKFPSGNDDHQTQKIDDPEASIHNTSETTEEHVTTGYNEVKKHSSDNSSESSKKDTKNDILSDVGVNPDRLITLMYLLEVGRLESSDIAAQLDSPYCQKLSAMASFFVNVSSDLQEAFFLFRNFTRKLEENETLDT